MELFVQSGRLDDVQQRILTQHIEHIEQINKDIRELIYLEVHKYRLKKVHVNLLELFRLKELRIYAINYNILRIGTRIGTR